MSNAPPKRLGDLLVEKNLVLPEQLDVALEKQKKSDKRLGQILVEMDLVTYEGLYSVLSEQSGIPHVWLRKGLIDPKIVDILPRAKAEDYCVIPMFKIRNSLTLAMAECEDIFILDDIRQMTGCAVQPVKCRTEDIQDAIKEYYSALSGMEDFLESFKESDVEILESRFEDLKMIEEHAEGAKIINLVNLAILNAVKEGASDIHIEADAKISRVRYRIDGTLQEVMTLRSDLHPSVISRIKVMSGMDIAERRIPQDGRIHILVSGREVDIRVSTMPTIQGEKIVMRLLDKTRLMLDINNIGIENDTLISIKTMLKRPNGIILVTGPTGSGKTTTLYSGLSYLSSIAKNVITIEDPVEYQLELINQVQVREDQGLGFARTLRSVLRQDPDIIMLGEIRDRETAEVAIQAALTGHLVLSTLHTNDSAGAIARLTEMGIEPYLQTSAIIGVIAQRLLRKVCPDCRIDFLPPREFLRKINWTGKNKKFVTGRGCKCCYDTGLRGQTGIYELLKIDEAIRRVILKDPSAESIREQWRKSGARSLKDAAFKLVEENITSLEEAMRVVYVEVSADEVEALVEN